jgi:hypothetical protein
VRNAERANGPGSERCDPGPAGQVTETRSACWRRPRFRPSPSTRRTGSKVRVSNFTDLYEPMITSATAPMRCTTNTPFDSILVVDVFVWPLFSSKAWTRTVEL